MSARRAIGGGGVRGVANDRSSGVELWEGVITTAPASALGFVGVAARSRPDHEIVVTGRWSPRGTHLPAKGDPCTVGRGPTSDPVVVAWEPAGDGGAASVPGTAGEIRLWPVADVPSGWLACNGAELAAEETALIALLSAAGNPYGVGVNGRPNVPDLRGRSPMGAGTGSSPTLTARTVGQKVGAETHVLDVTQIPAHTHGINGEVPGAGGTASGTHPVFKNPAAANWALDAGTSPIYGGGGGLAHPNVQPSTVVNFIIKT